MRCLSSPVALALLLSIVCLTPALHAADVTLTLEKGDRISIVGNTLADRMQHDGWMETMIHSRFPELDLAFRNLGYSADEITTRPRSENFGSPDDWLNDTKADVVFAFFGYNESFNGEAGLDKFRKQLGDYIDHLRANKYNGKSAPRIVLFSPIGHENLNKTYLPDGSENNARLAMYTKAMAEVAQQKNVPFVDLFNPTQKLYQSAKSPLTVNGVHLLSEGNRQIAQLIVDQLFHGKVSKLGPEQTERLRQAILDRNFHWFNRYRTVDEYNVFGGRSKLNWHGQSNADVMMREMEVLKVMAANRDKRVWATARGSDITVDDSNLPPLVPVKTNKPGPLEDGSYPFLGGEEAIGKMEIAKGMKINLFASEEQFPELINPVQMAVDTDSRLWVATWPTYPHWTPTQPLRDKLVILPDDDGDGKADRLIVFADGLNSVTGFEFWGGGVIVAAAPRLLFLKDTDGDDKADVRIDLLDGISSADSHHTANSLVVGPDGALYFSHGVFHVDNHETPTKTFRGGQTGVYRFDPRTSEISFHFPIGPNPHGNVFDQWGYQFATDGTGGTGNHVAIGKGVGAPKQWYVKRVRPVPAIGILSSSHFPPENDGNFLICNAIGVLGVLQHEVRYNGADITAHEIEPIVLSSDPNFRPTDLEVGGDGALYISDWQNPLIGHMQHNIRDPNRDHHHGRVYRVTADGRPLLKPAKMKGKPINEVLANFFAKENGTRLRARIELSGRDTAEVVAAVSSWASQLDVSKPENEQALLEGLWVFAEHRVPDMALLTKVFQAKEPRVRAAAIRTLGTWGPTVKGWEDVLVAAARDGEALVRAEAVIAAVSFDGLAAAEAIFEAATRPTDEQLDFNLKYARGRINVDKLVQDAMKNNQPLSPAAQTYALQKANVETLLSMKRDDAVYNALVSRAGVPQKDRLEALDALAKKNSSSRIAELVAAIAREESNPQGGLGDLLGLLAATEPAELKPAANSLVDLATKAESSPTRKAAYAAWLEAEGSGERAWQHAVKSADTLRDLLSAYSTVRNAQARTSLYPKLRALMFELPEHLKSDASASQSASFGAMHVAYHQPARQTADLNTYVSLKPQAAGNAPQFRIDDAPVAIRDDFALVFTGTINIPRAGQYTFFTESDDGSRLYIDAQMVVNNDGLHGMSEKAGKVKLSAGPHEIVVTYFDNGGGDGLRVSWDGPGIKKEEIPASVLGGAGGGGIQDLAIAAVARTEGHEQEKIDDFARLITEGKHAASALQALAALPHPQVARQLSADRVNAVASALIEQADKATPVERETSAYANVLKLGESLSASAANKGDLRRKLAALRDSIPVKADAKVMALGQEVYFRESHCATCHQPNGQGLPSLYPPLDGSSWATGSEDRLIRLTLNGMYGTITVKGETFSSPPLPPMTGFHSLLNDNELAAVLTFVRNSWSNRAKPVEPQTVAQVRKDLKGRTEFWHAAELAKMYPPEEGSNVTVAPADTAQPGWIPVFVKNWQLADFDKELAASAGPANQRSIEQGKLAFNRLGCVQCHKIKGEGGALGPDLTEVARKWKNDRRELLLQILEPSRVVEDQYKTNELVTKDGDQYFGLITEKTADHVLIVTNAQNPVPMKIALKDIESQKVTPMSLMPQGLLSLLTREQVLDMLAYLEAPQ